LTGIAELCCNSRQGQKTVGVESVKAGRECVDEGGLGRRGFFVDVDGRNCEDGKLREGMIGKDEIDVEDGVVEIGSERDGKGKP
jgi:hypothetical protein